MKIVIREIQENDYPAVVSLWESDLGYKISLEQLSKKMKMMKADDCYKTFVAISENLVVGFIALEQSLDFVSPIGCLRVNALAVSSSYQRKGVGTELMLYAEEYAKEKGLSSVILNSGIQRTEAYKFYIKIGYDKDSYCFDKRL